MKMTTLDVLIVTALAEGGMPVVLPHIVFNSYAQFIKQSPLFRITRPTNQQIQIQVRDIQAFERKLKYWRVRYEQDNLLPFDENDFGIIRLVENASVFAHLANMNAGKWDLQADKYYLHDKKQPRSGLCWAWDWFIVSQIAHKECSQEVKASIRKMGLHLTVSTRQDFAFLYCQLVNSYFNLSQLEQELCVALRERTEWGFSCGPLFVAKQSQRVAISHHPVKFTKKDGRAIKLLKACAETQALGKILSYNQAFALMYGKGATYRRNGTKHRLSHDFDSYRTKGPLTDKIKRQKMKNVQRYIQQKFDDVAKQFNLRSKITLSISKTKGVRLQITS